MTHDCSLRWVVVSPSVAFFSHAWFSHPCESFGSFFLLYLFWCRKTWHIWVIWIEWVFVTRGSSEWMHVAHTKKYFIQKNNYDTIIGQMECRLSRFVCDSQALNPNSWINVFSCWIHFFCFTFQHKIIFGNHNLPQINTINHCCCYPEVNFITYSTFVPFQCAYYSTIHNIQCRIETRSSQRDFHRCQSNEKELNKTAESVAWIV